jgi:hypothetical protein
MRTASLAAVAVLSTLLGRAAPAAAETTPVTSIHQMMILESGDKNYRLFHGAIWLDIDKASQNYRWGGAHCPGKDLSASNIQILFAAFRNEYAVSLEYSVIELKGKPYRCITGFTISKT